jgi:hypothetical protein
MRVLFIVAQNVVINIESPDGLDLSVAVIIGAPALVEGMDDIVLLAPFSIKLRIQRAECGF